MEQGKKDQRTYPDELHRELGMTPEEVRQSYADEGVDPDEVVAQMRRLGRVMAARFAPQIEAEERAKQPNFTAPLPVFGESVAAGPPVWAEAVGTPPAKASLSDVLAGGKAEDTILARVSGWSMRDEGINDGDFVMVNIKMEAKDGDVVLAHIAGEGQVVKRLVRLPGKLVLRSANPEFADIEVKDAAALRIHGVVVGRAGKI